MPYREFTDGAGVAWRAWETRPHSAANVRPRYADGWLTFECDSERRRLGPIPEAWIEADSRALASWLLQAEPHARVAETRVRVRPRSPADAPADGLVAESIPSAEGTTGPSDDPAVAMERTRSTIQRVREILKTIDVSSPGDAAADKPPAS